MSKLLRFSSLVALVASTACFIIDDDDDDDDNGDTSNVTESASNTNATASASESSTAAGSSGAVDSSGSGTAGIAGCGWGELPGQDNVDDGYTCGGEGEDPKGVFARDCPESVALESGGDCGGDMGVTGVGCCDGTTVWYCADNGSGPQLFSESCG